MPVDLNRGIWCGTARLAIHALSKEYRSENVPYRKVVFQPRSMVYFTQSPLAFLAYFYSATLRSWNTVRRGEANFLCFSTHNLGVQFIKGINGFMGLLMFIRATQSKSNQFDSHIRILATFILIDHVSGAVSKPTYRSQTDGASQEVPGSSGVHLSAANELLLLLPQYSKQVCERTIRLVERWVVQEVILNPLPFRLQSISFFQWDSSQYSFQLVCIMVIQHYRKLPIVKGILPGKLCILTQEHRNATCTRERPALVTPRETRLLHSPVKTWAMRRSTSIDGLPHTARPSDDPGRSNTERAVVNCGAVLLAVVEEMKILLVFMLVKLLVHNLLPNLPLP